MMHFSMMPITKVERTPKPALMPVRALRWLTVAVCATLAGMVAADSGSAAQENGNNWIEDIFKSDQSGPKKATSDKPREGSIKEDEQLLDGLNTKYVLASQEVEQAMLGALDRYEKVVAKGGWPMIPKGRTLRIGDQDENVLVLRRRLAITDGLSRNNLDDWTFDEDVEAAVRNFQVRHGIPPNGRVDRRTLYALNVSAEARLTQLRVNINRMREQLANGMPPRFVMVNIPAFELQAVSYGRLDIQSRVIVGRTERPSPSVGASIKAVNFFPYWHVPESVAQKDIIPKLQKDPSYIDREYIRPLTDWSGEEIDPTLIDWHAAEAMNIKFRQDPGPHNALGLVRMDMPNEHSVYMHDTPMKNLFGRSTRAFSAGCVRVQRVFDVVTWLLEPEGEWNRARVDSVLASGVPLDIQLKEQVPVYFVYFTAWVSPNGIVNFRPDLYDRDGSEGMAVAEQQELVSAEGAMPNGGLAP